MPTQAYLTYDMMVDDPNRSTANGASATGGSVIICKPGTAQKATLYDPDNNFAVLANPVAMNRGRLRFATVSTILSVDVYGVAGTGNAINLRNVRPGAEGEIYEVTDDPMQVLCVPLFAGDYTAATEGTTGLQLPAASLVLPNIGLRVLTAESSKTLDFGLLSSESGGDADGFLAALSLASAVMVKPLVTGTPTRGLLLRATFATTPAVYLPDSAAITTSRTLSATFSSGSATAEAFVLLNFFKPPV